MRGDFLDQDKAWKRPRNMATAMSCFFTVVALFTEILLVCLYPPSVTAGTIVGEIRFTGPVPPPTQATVTKDPETCGPTQMIQPVQVDSTTRGLQGVVISVDSVNTTLPDRSLSAPIVTNRDCRFLPRIAAAQVKQSVHIRNEDPILHNTHLYLGKRTIVNVALVPGGREIKKTLKKPGHILIKCDKHRFMRAHLWVFAHPYFAVTDGQGRFQIPDVPAGSYELAIWHETLGTISALVMVPDQGEVTIAIDYPTSPR